MKKEENEYRFANYAIKCLAYILKWLFLICAVVNIALVVAVLVIAIFRIETVENVNMISELMELMTRYNISEINELINEVGFVKVVTGGVAIGLAHVINFVALYVLVSNFITIFSTFEEGNMYTKENVDIVNASLPFAFILTFTQPVIVFVTTFATGLYDATDINVSGLGVLIIVYISKLLFDKGYEISLKKDKANKELSEQKLKLSEAKMEELKKEINKTSTTKKPEVKKVTPEVKKNKTVKKTAKEKTNTTTKK